MNLSEKLWRRTSVLQRWKLTTLSILHALFPILMTFLLTIKSSSFFVGWCWPLLVTILARNGSKPYNFQNERAQIISFMLRTTIVNNSFNHNFSIKHFLLYIHEKLCLHQEQYIMTSLWGGASCMTLMFSCQQWISNVTSCREEGMERDHKDQLGNGEREGRIGRREWGRKERNWERE